MSMEIKNCARCGEEAYHVSAFDPEVGKSIHVVRVKRRSKCKGYQTKKICQTGICRTEEGAVYEWNKQFGKP